MPSATASPRRPRDLVVHIGSGKTGTTSLQHLMAHNRERLAELGVLYPVTPGEARHVRLGLMIRTGAELEAQGSWHNQGFDTVEEFREDFERRLFAEIDEADLPRVLFSDEALYGCSKVALTRLRELFDRLAASLRVVVYLRRQDDHLCSRYQQVVKVGEVRRLSQRLRELDLSGTYDYHARLQTWQQLMEPTTFVVRRFERSSFVDGSLAQDFLDAAGLETRADELGQAPTHNESLDAESVEFLRILNLFRVERKGARVGLINNRKIVVRLADASTGPTLTLPESDLDRFMAQWEESNRRVATEFLGDETGRLFREPRKTRGTTSEQYLDPERLDHFLALAELPQRMHRPLRRLAERAARAH